MAPDFTQLESLPAPKWAPHHDAAKTDRDALETHHGRVCRNALRRNCVGVSLIAFRRERERWLWSAKPWSAAMSATLRSVRRRSRQAPSSRTSCTRVVMVRPKVRAKVRDKCTGWTPTLRAISVIGVGLSDWVQRRSHAVLSQPGIAGAGIPERRLIDDRFSICTSPAS